MTAFLSYFLIKVTPPWGLALMFTTVIYFAPLAYIMNKEFIDEHLNNAQNILSEQATQVRDLAATHTGKAYEASSSALKNYAAQAQEAIGSGKKAAVEKGYVSQETADKVTPEKKAEDFPSAPKAEPAVPEAAPAEEHKSEPIAA